MPSKMLLGNPTVDAILTLDVDFDDADPENDLISVGLQVVRATPVTGVE